ncbi:MAG: recombination mediator RecR [Finegoldia sp.]|nr:recombination mediator RecR [Finegoldia sp.]
MTLYPKPIDELIKNLSNMPSIGRKSAGKLAYKIIDMDPQRVKALVDSIVNVKTQIRPCKNCGNLTDSDLCSICADKNRDKSVITVVEDSLNVISLEKTREYKGMYHVLGGLLSPRDNISPKDLNLQTLFKRCQKDYVKEVILALSPTTNGDLTTNFIIEVLKKEDYGIKISKIANGVPLGANLEYFDEMGLYKAILDRREVR